MIFIEHSSDDFSERTHLSLMNGQQFKEVISLSLIVFKTYILS